MNIYNTKKALTLLASAFDNFKQTVSPISFPERKKALAPSHTSYFEGVTPESVGITSERVLDFISELFNNKSVGLQGIMLLRNDKVFFEADVGLQSSKYPKATFSECKSVISLAIGALITERKLRLNEKVIDIFPDKVNAVSKLRYANLTVRHLLTMTSSVNFNELEAMVSEDWVKSFFASDTANEVGEAFSYNSLNSYILSAIITRKTGKSVTEYLNETIFGELGISNFYWEKCPMGIEKGGWGLYITREDIAKLGLLVLNGGAWNGKQIISKRYIEECTKPKVAVPRQYGDFDYSYHIWCGRKSDSFLFNGIFGQNLLSYKRNGIIIVSNAGNLDLFQKSEFFNICDRYFNYDFPAFIEENEDGYEKLLLFKETLLKAREIKSFLRVSESKRDIKADLLAIDGRKLIASSANSVSVGFLPLLLQIIQSNYTSGIKEIAFFKGEDSILVDFCEADYVSRVEFGFSEPISNRLSFNGEEFWVTAKATFSDSEDGIPVLTLDCDFIETPFSRRIKFFFESGNIYAIFSEQPAASTASGTDELFASLGDGIRRASGFVTKLDADYLKNKLGNSFSPRVTLIECN